MARFWSSGLPAAILFVFGVVWTGMMVLQPRAGEPVAAIFSPMETGRSALSGAILAGAETILATGALDTIVVVTSNQSNFVERLRQAGALIVLRAPFGGFCKG